MSERRLLDQALADHPFVFRNDCGRGYVGGTVIRAKAEQPIIAHAGQLVVINPQVIAYGLYPGSGDLVGWEPITITPEMVGQQIAVFTSVEVKTVHDNLSNKQRNWFRRVKEYGGIAEIYKELRDGSVIRITEI
jgi:ribosomal protein S19